LATETANWYTIHRSAQKRGGFSRACCRQNGIANSGGTTYITEGRSVATNSVVTNGANSTTVTPSMARPARPVDRAGCYKVTGQRNVPISMLKIVA